MSRVRVLQCGFPKSGNYVFYRAIREIMEEEGWRGKGGDWQNYFRAGFKAIDALGGNRGCYVPVDEAREVLFYRCVKV